MYTFNIFADLRLDSYFISVYSYFKVRTVGNLAGKACTRNSVFEVMKRSCWKGRLVPPPYREERLVTPPCREERLVTPPCREERLVTPPYREERLIRARRSVSLHTIACRLHACSASCYTLVTRILRARSESCSTLVARLVARL